MNSFIAGRQSIPAARVCMYYRVEHECAIIGPLLLMTFDSAGSLQQRDVC